MRKTIGEDPIDFSLHSPSVVCFFEEENFPVWLSSTKENSYLLPYREEDESSSCYIGRYLAGREREEKSFCLAPIEIKQKHHRCY